MGVSPAMVITPIFDACFYEASKKKLAEMPTFLVLIFSLSVQVQIRRTAPQIHS